jgi:hypothetical protein
MLPRKAIVARHSIRRRNSEAVIRRKVAIQTLAR